MKNVPEGKSLRSVVVFCLVGLYFVLAVGVTLLGSSIYRAVASTADETSTQRTALSYVVNQVRRSSAPVVLGEFEDCQALRLDEVLPDGSVYATYIYFYDGQLRELYTEVGSGLGPADGGALIGLDSLEFSAQNGLLTVSANGHAVTLYPQAGLEEVGEV